MEDDVEEVNESGNERESKSQQALELSIVILVDGEEKCSSRTGSAKKSGRAVTACSSYHRKLQDNSNDEDRQFRKSPSAVSLPSCNKRLVIGPIRCGDQRERRCQSVDRSYTRNECENCSQFKPPTIVPTPQSNCPCASLRSQTSQEARSGTSPCRHQGHTCVQQKSACASCGQSPCPSSHPCGQSPCPSSHPCGQSPSASHPCMQRQTPCASHPCRQKSPCASRPCKQASTSPSPCTHKQASTSPSPCAQKQSRSPCKQTQYASPPCMPKEAPARPPCKVKSQLSTVACQTVPQGGSQTEPCRPPSTPCPPKPCKPKPCKPKAAKSAICQTQPDPCRPRSRPKTVQPCRPKSRQKEVESEPESEVEEPVTPRPKSPRKKKERREKREETEEEEEKKPEVKERKRSAKRDEEEEKKPEVKERKRSAKRDEEEERKPEVKERKRSAKRDEVKEEEQEEKPRKKKRSSEAKKLVQPADAKIARTSMPKPEDLNYAHFPTVQLNFVDYFLKTEGGVTSVIVLAEVKQEFEKNCKALLAKVPEQGRNDAKEFFLKILEAIEVKVPDSNNTEIKHYNLMKYLQPIVEGLGVQANDELASIQKYHKYILEVVQFMEDRLRNKEVINPDALVDIETHLLAGVMSRFYPLFIKLEELLVSLSSQRGAHEKYPPDNFAKQLRRLILAIYVEITCIDVTCNNVLTSLTYLPSVEVQEKYRHHFAIRKKHARHSVTWAARCIASVLLFYFIGR